MIKQMGTGTGGFNHAYAQAFRAFLHDEAEASRRAAYELGRQAAGHSIGLLELAQVHHEALIGELASSASAEDVESTTRAGADFMLEALSAYEMLRLGFTEARDAVASGQRQARMLRQLSTLLADASLVHAQHSVGEVLKLVAEQTRELTGATSCIAWMSSGSPGRSPTVAHCGAPEPALRDLAREAFAAAALAPDRTQVLRVQTPRAAAALDVVALTALNGEPIGVLAVANGSRRPFSEPDKAMLIHIAQMTSAALERATHYNGPD
jgi:GAF domain-containing protein